MVANYVKGSVNSMTTIEPLIIPVVVEGILVKVLIVGTWSRKNRFRYEGACDGVSPVYGYDLDSVVRVVVNEYRVSRGL